MRILQVALSTAQKVKLRMPVGGPGGTPLAVVLTRGEFEKLTAPLYRRARLPIDQACWQVSFHAYHMLHPLPIWALGCMVQGLVHQI